MHYTQNLELAKNNLLKSKMDEFDTPKKAYEEACHLLDIEESCQKLSQQLLPRVNLSKVTQAQMQELLWDIKEELAHLFYHIKASAYLQDIQKRFDQAS